MLCISQYFPSGGIWYEVSPLFGDAKLDLLVKVEENWNIPRVRKFSGWEGLKYVKALTYVKNMGFE